MAYGKKTTRRKAARPRRASRRASRSGSKLRFASTGNRSTRKRASRGSGTIRLELVQVPAQPQISPIHQLLMDQQKVITPRRARF